MDTRGRRGKINEENTKRKRGENSFTKVENMENSRKEDNEKTETSRSTRLDAERRLGTTTSIKGSRCHGSHSF